MFQRQLLLAAMVLLEELVPLQLLVTALAVHLHRVQLARIQLLLGVAGLLQMRLQMLLGMRMVMTQLLLGAAAAVQVLLLGAAALAVLLPEQIHLQVVLGSAAVMAVHLLERIQLGSAAGVLLQKQAPLQCGALGLLLVPVWFLLLGWNRL